VALAGPKRASALEAALHALVRDLGFQGGLYVHLGHALRPAGGAVVCTPVRFVATAVSDRRLYVEEGALACDPVMDRAARAHTPFAWTSAITPDLTPAQKQLHTRLRGRGIYAGVAAPVQDYAAGPAYLSLYSVFGDEAERLARENGPELAYAAAEFHERAKAQLPAFSEDADRHALTPREIECMRLAAIGWTSAQSGTALHLATRTVEFHLQNAASKLGAPNRVCAVAMAVSQGLIAL
jgi:DNA-binding CsgD family transcriptional regulator